MIFDQQGRENTRSYYDAEGRLRATDRRGCVARPVDGAYRCVGWEAAPGREPGAFEEYRYDALDRRVLVRTRFETGQYCVYLEQCRNRVVRTVWEDIVIDGDIAIRHHYREGDHGPAHMHVTGGGRPTNIGPNGRPISGQPELTRMQARVVNMHLSTIRRAGNKIGRWLQHREGARQ